MDRKITRNVQDLESSERQVYESVLGEKLRANQTIIIHVMTIGKPAGSSEASRPRAGKLPDWCDVYAGLPDDVISDVEQVALQRSDMSRPSQ